MARVIKGVGGPARSTVPPVDGKKVIEKEVWRAQQDAVEVMKRAEKERERIFHEGRQRAAQAREEAQAEGAAEAFSEAAKEALEAFRRRAERYAEASDDIRVLALEIVRKVLGTAPKLAPDVIDVILRTGLDKLRARRKLRVQVPKARHDALARERPALLERVATEPDLVIEAVGDVSAGFARVVTEVGGALCSEQSALDQLASALGVEERATAPRPKSAVQALEPDTPFAPVETFDEDEEEDTHFLRKDRGADGKRPAEISVGRSAPGAARVASGGAARPVAVAAGRKAPPPPPEGDSTMALDVSDLRDELRGTDDDPSDELDLFADEAVVSSRRPR